MNKNDDSIIERAKKSQKNGELHRASKRGEVTSPFGNKLREHLQELGEGVTMESKKPIAEGIGEVLRSN